MRLEFNEVLVAVPTWQWSLLNYHINEVITCHLTRRQVRYECHDPTTFQANMYSTLITLRWDVPWEWQLLEKWNTAKQCSEKKSNEVYWIIDRNLLKVFWGQTTQISLQSPTWNGSRWKLHPSRPSGEVLVLQAKAKTFPVNTMTWLGCEKNLRWGQMNTAAGGLPTPTFSSFIPIHFNYPGIPTIFPMSRLAQPGNLQLILPHLRQSNGGGRETSSNGMKCHSVIAFVTKMLARSDREGLEKSH